MQPDTASREGSTDAVSIRPRAILETVLYVDDLDAASDFYTSALNLQLVHGDGRMKVLRVTDRNLLLLFKAGATLEPVEVDGGTIPGA